MAIMWGQSCHNWQRSLPDEGPSSPPNLGLGNADVPQVVCQAVSSVPSEHELACTQLYCENIDAFESVVDGLPSTQSYGLEDEAVDEKSCPEILPPRQCNDMACTQAYEDESEDDFTADLLQAGKAEQPTEMPEASSTETKAAWKQDEPDKALMPGSACGQRPVISGGGGIQSSAVSGALESCREDAGVGPQAAEFSDELGCTLHYNTHEGSEEAAAPAHPEAPAANAVETSRPEILPPRQCNDLACTQAYNDESEDDFTADLLQAGKAEQPTQMPEASSTETKAAWKQDEPDKALMPGSACGQRPVISGGGGIQSSAVSGALESCREDAGVGPQAAEFSDELGCTLHYNTHEGSEEAAAPAHPEAPAANAVETSRPEILPPRQCNDLACTQAYNDESEDDFTADLLQAGNAEQPTEMPEASSTETKAAWKQDEPDKALVPGSACGQRPVISGGGEIQSSAVSGALESCREDAGVGPQPAEFSDELGCTLHYNTHEGSEEAAAPAHPEAPAANVVETSRPEILPPRQCNDMACTQAYNDESEDDFTADLLQAGKAEQPTEMPEASSTETKAAWKQDEPDKALVPGSACGQRPVISGGGEIQSSAVSGALESCREDAGVGPQAAEFSDELGCTLHYNTHEGSEEAAAPAHPEAPAANAVETSRPEILPPRQCNDLACTQAYNDESEDDFTADLLQAGNAEQPTEMPEASSTETKAAWKQDEPDKALVPGSACGQRPVISGGGEIQSSAVSGALESCREDAGVGPQPAEFSDELGCTLHYNTHEGSEEAAAPAHPEAPAANVVETSRPEILPPRQCNDMACTQAYNDESEDDFTADLLQAGKAEQPTEMPQASSSETKAAWKQDEPDKALVPGSACGQRPVISGGGEIQSSAVSGALESCREDAGVGPQPAEFSDELGCTLHYNTHEGSEEAAAPAHPAANVVETSRPEILPPRQCNDMACTQAYNDESEDDFTADLLQAGKAEQPTEMPQASSSETKAAWKQDEPDKALVPGSACGQRPVISGGGEIQSSAVSGALESCREDAGVGPQPAEFSDELGCTLHYNTHEGSEEAAAPAHPEAPAANAVETSRPEILPPRQCNDLACTQAYNDESEDDFTADLLQAGKAEQPTEMPQASSSETKAAWKQDEPDKALVPGSACGQRPVISGGGEIQSSAVSGALESCREDAGVGPQPAEFSDELGCTLHYNTHEGSEEAAAPAHPEAPAANAVETSRPEILPPRQCNDLACTQAYNDESEDDFTADLLQAGKAEQPTEMPEASSSETKAAWKQDEPDKALVPGSACGQRPVISGGGEIPSSALSGALESCREDAGVGPQPAEFSASAQNLLFEPAACGVGHGAVTAEAGLSKEPRQSLIHQSHLYGAHYRHRPCMVSVMVQTGETDDGDLEREAVAMPSVKVANSVPTLKKPQPPRLSLLIPKRPRDENIELVDVDAYSAASHALWGGRTPKKAAAPCLRDFLAAKQEEAEEADEPLLGTALGSSSMSPMSPISEGRGSSPNDLWCSQRSHVKQEDLSVKRGLECTASSAPTTGAPGIRDRSRSPHASGPQQPLPWVPLGPKQESPQQVWLVSHGKLL